MTSRRTREFASARDVKLRMAGTLAFGTLE